MTDRTPDQLWLVESFLNSIDVDSGQDDLYSVGRFRRWLHDHHRPVAAKGVSEADLALARKIRAGLRELLGGHGGDSPTTTSADIDRRASLTGALGQVPLRMSIDNEGIGLAPAATGVAHVLGEVLSAVVLANHEGTWRRLKKCRAGTCQAVFYDRSKNSSRRWCSMAACGNRDKIRTYRDRRTSRPPE
ncbi:CGNR zinc finger domain-containing protein [Nesterenkonia ebinurensis]|uniref:CGNR zinc finger domain-containing protein n=1 Tax=Nesterenkonia ebinurensis TaxID=2608252 RepID=UPI00123D2F55|nr:CGNR zinc finger domain-containing protein [Nesterenkonia ebinurensis]